MPRFARASEFLDPRKPEVYVLSDSTGETAMLLMQRLLVQFKDQPQPTVILKSFVTRPAQLAEILMEATANGGNPYIFASLVEPKMITWLDKLAHDLGARVWNLMPPLLKEMDGFFGVQAKGVPGIAGMSLNRRQLNEMVSQEFLGMVEAAQFLRQHSSNQRSEDWKKADMVLVGASRCGKVGIASTLAQRGKRVATLNIEDGMPVPEELFQLKDTPVVFVQRDVETLVKRREARLLELRLKNINGVLAPDYADLDKVRRDIAAVDALAKKHAEWIGPIDVTWTSESDSTSSILGRIVDLKLRQQQQSGGDAGDAGAGSFSPLLLAAPIVAALVAFVATRAEPPEPPRPHTSDGMAFAGARLRSSRRVRCLRRLPPPCAAGGPDGGPAAPTALVAPLGTRAASLDDTRAPTLDKVVFIVSDGTGETAKLVMSKLLVQYSDFGVPTVKVFGQVTKQEQLNDIMQQAGTFEKDQFLIFCTLVDPVLCDLMEQMAKTLDIRKINLMTDLLKSVGDWLGSSARGIPGDDMLGGPLKTQSAVNANFFKMAEAVQFVQQHISGLNQQDWPQADVVIVGLGRSGTEVVATYLGQLGIRAACLSISPGEPVPRELFLMPPEKVVVLSMELEALVQRRKNQLLELERRRAPSFFEGGYADRERIEFEAEFMSDLVRKNPEWRGPIDCTYRAVNECCSAVIRELRI